MRRSLFILLATARLPLAAQTAAEPSQQRFRWKAAILQSFEFVVIEHVIRIAGEPDTRSQLGGPFWRDYGRSVTGISGWGDGDPWGVNYVGHPFQGAVTGFIEIQNDPAFRQAEFGKTSLYWRSRTRALAWSAAYSTQFEIGPLSEASIGHVGLKPGTAGFVDLVVTPAGGFAVILLEDALDRFVVRRCERWMPQPIARALFRGVLNPNRSLANMLAGRVPWHRDTRPGVTVR